MTNCKSCSAPLLVNSDVCEYCGALVEANKSSLIRDVNYSTSEVFSGVPSVLRPDSYRTQDNSIKPQANVQDTAIHWTIILSFIFSILLFFGSFGAEASNDWIIGFVFIALLSLVFNFSGVKNYSQKNWMVTTNYVLLGLSVFLSLIILA